MKLLRSTYMACGWIFLVAVCLSLASPPMAGARDAKSMLKQVNKELRQAQNDMFSGKNDKAIASLEGIEDLLLKVKAADPNNSGFKSAERKYKKLIKDLERRTGKDLGGGTLTAAGTSTKTQMAPKPEAAPMPAKPAAAAPAKSKGQATASQADKLLRTAERSMHAGKNEEAAGQLAAAKAIIDGIKIQDPANPKLGSLEKKHQRIEKKLAAKAPKAAPQPTGEAPPADSKAAAKAEKLPYHARGPISNAKNGLARIDGYIQRLKDPTFDGVQVLRNMDAVFEGARESLEMGKAKAAEKGVTSHPDFDEIEAGLKETEKKIAAAKSDYAKAEAAAEAGAAEVNADVKALKDEYDRVSGVFEKATGSVFHYNDLKAVRGPLAEIEAFEKNDLAKVTAGMEAFAKKYGSTRDEIDKKADAMGYVNNYYRASFAYTELAKGIENIGKTRTVMADDLVRRAKDMKANAKKGLHDFSRIKQHSVIKEWGVTAAAYDPENPRVTEFNAGLDAWAAADLKDLNAKIDKAGFPRQASDAPDDAEELAETIREFLQREEDKKAAKGKMHGKIASVVITGPWRVFKRNILAEPIQYNLPFACATQLADEESLNLTRVFLMTMLTREMKGVKMAPPFIGATVGNSYYVRSSKVK